MLNWILVLPRQFGIPFWLVSIPMLALPTDQRIHTRVVQRISTLLRNDLYGAPTLSSVPAAPQDDVVFGMVVQTDAAFTETEQRSRFRDRQSRNAVECGA